jgi:hypothetical protein
LLKDKFKQSKVYRKKIIMASKHTLEQIINVSKDLMRISSLNDAFLEIRPDKLSTKSFIYLKTNSNAELRYNFC